MSTPTPPDHLSEAVTKLLACQPAHASRDCSENTILRYHTERGAIEIFINGTRGDARNVWVRLGHDVENVYGEELREAADYWGWNWLSFFTEKKRQEALDQVLSAIRMKEEVR